MDKRIEAIKERFHYLDMSVRLQADHESMLRALEKLRRAIYGPMPLPDVNAPTAEWVNWSTTSQVQEKALAEATEALK